MTPARTAEGHTGRRLPQLLPDDTRALIVSIAPRDRAFTSSLVRRHYPNLPASTVGSALLRMVLDGYATRERGAGQWRYRLTTCAGCHTDGA